MRKPLTDRDKSFLALVARSPDVGDGWRNVSDAVWPLVEAFTRPELIEAVSSQHAPGGGRLRLTERGAILCEYL